MDNPYLASTMICVQELGAYSIRRLIIEAHEKSMYFLNLFFLCK